MTTAGSMWENHPRRTTCPAARSIRGPGSQAVALSETLVGRPVCGPSAVSNGISSAAASEERGHHAPSTAPRPRTGASSNRTGSRSDTTSGGVRPSPADSGADGPSWRSDELSVSGGVMAHQVPAGTEPAAQQYAETTELRGRPGARYERCSTSRARDNLCVYSGMRWFLGRRSALGLEERERSRFSGRSSVRLHLLDLACWRTHGEPRLAEGVTVIGLTKPHKFPDFGLNIDE